MSYEFDLSESGNRELSSVVTSILILGETVKPLRWNRPYQSALIQDLNRCFATLRKLLGTLDEEIPIREPISNLANQLEELANFGIGSNDFRGGQQGKLLEEAVKTAEALRADLGEAFLYPENHHASHPMVVQEVAEKIRALSDKVSRTELKRIESVQGEISRFGNSLLHRYYPVRDEPLGELVWTKAVLLYDVELKNKHINYSSELTGILNGIAGELESATSY